jgi:Holliday junction DNA helicase RuvB
MMKSNEDKDILSGDRLDNEDDYITDLRPQKLNDFIGQENIKESLKISISAALNRGDSLDHILFYGPPGLGKTTLAHCISNEMDTRIVICSGPTLVRPGDIVGPLTNLKNGDVLFIDEIHRLPRIVEEFLYPAIEDFRITLMVDKGPHARSIQMDLKRFTLIGATTRVGLLTNPLRERFGIFHHLDFYDIGSLTEIVKRSARILGVNIDGNGARIIAERSRGTPRVANRVLKRVRDYAEVKHNSMINEEIANESLESYGIDSLGLSELDRRYLSVIIDTYKGGPVGIGAIAATLNEEEDTIIDMVEPYLLKIGFLGRTKRGRIITDIACEHLGVELKLSDDQISFWEKD